MVATIWMSLDVEKDHGTGISQKTRKKKVLEELVPLQTWKHFLEGIKSQFEIWTNLEYFMKVQKLD